MPEKRTAGGERNDEVRRARKEKRGGRGGGGGGKRALGRRWDGKADGVRHTPHAIIME